MRRWSGSEIKSPYTRLCLSCLSPFFFACFVFCYLFLDVCSYYQIFFFCLLKSNKLYNRLCLILLLQLLKNFDCLKTLMQSLLHKTRGSNDQPMISSFEGKHHKKKNRSSSSTFLFWTWGKAERKQLRLCNSTTIETLLDHKFYTTIDLNNGFWNVPLAEETK